VETFLSLNEKGTLFRSRVPQVCLDNSKFKLFRNIFVVVNLAKNKKVIKSIL
jgi:hypothetical protein